MSKEASSPIERQNVDVLLDQLEFLVDELSAQQKQLARLPEAVFEAAPVDGGPSIRDRYASMLRRETYLNRAVVRGFLDGSLVGEEVPEFDSVAELDSEHSTLEILDQLCRSRFEVVELLRSADADAWTATAYHRGRPVDLGSWAYHMAVEEAEDLRKIVVQFSEQRLTFSDD